MEDQKSGATSIVVTIGWLVQIGEVGIKTSPNITNISFSKMAFESGLERRVVAQSPSPKADLGHSSGLVSDGLEMDEQLFGLNDLRPFLRPIEEA